MFFKKTDPKIVAPTSGTMMALSEVPDETFASGMLGPGLALKPASNQLVSPIAGEVTMVFPTGHAIGIKRQDGLELLVHIGIDTVNLNGHGFDVLVKVGSKVSQGDLLAHIDRQVILGSGLDDTIIMIVTNSDDFVITDKIKTGLVQANEPIGKIKKR